MASKSNAVKAEKPKETEFNGHPLLNFEPSKERFPTQLGIGKLKAIRAHVQAFGLRYIEAFLDKHDTGDGGGKRKSVKASTSEE
jgi:hypothetical protein